VAVNAVWHVISRSGEAYCNCYTRIFYFLQMTHS